MDQPPPKLRGYDFLKVLGQGHFCVVWLVFDQAMNWLRAVKVVPPKRFRESTVRRLKTEAQTMARLPAHPNRVRVYQIKENPTNCFVFMDCVDGGALHERISPTQPMPWGQAARYVAGVAAALVDMHAIKLLHLDIKPDNIFLDKGRDEAVLGDFGLAAFVEELRGFAGGTDGYMAPEVLRGGASVKSDVFSLARTLQHLVTGHQPATVADLNRLPAWTELPAEMRAVIMAGADPVLDRRADLATFLGMLREARWKALADRVLESPQRRQSRVRLQVYAEVARADDPKNFQPVRGEDAWPVTPETGDLVRVRTQATVDGYHTVINLANDGGHEVVLPRPMDAENYRAASQDSVVVVKLRPPTGTDRLLLLWTRNDVRRTHAAWREWLESAGLPDGLDGPSAGPRTRGLEIVGTLAGPAPEGDVQAYVLRIPHGAAV